MQNGVLSLVLAEQKDSWEALGYMVPVLCWKLRECSQTACAEYAEDGGVSLGVILLGSMCVTESESNQRGSEGVGVGVGGSVDLWGHGHFQQCRGPL